jgi:hypothetical protein
MTNPEFRPGTASELQVGSFFRVEESHRIGDGWGARNRVRRTGLYQVVALPGKNGQGVQMYDVIDLSGRGSRKAYRASYKIEFGENYTNPAPEVLFVENTDRPRGFKY